MNIEIPPAALEAGARALYVQANPDLKWEDCAIECGQDVRQAYLFRARAACLAMLKAWPEMERERIGDGCEWPLTEEFTDQIILPLAAPSGALTEASDDPQKA
jgi:hypothetical protein